MRRIEVNPEMLVSCAAGVEETRDVYQSCCRNLFALSDELTATWKGDDSAAFTQRFMELRTTCDQIAWIIGQYAGFVNNSARAYQAMQEEITARLAGIGG